MAKRRKDKTFDNFSDAFAEINAPAEGNEKKRGIIYSWVGTRNYGFISDLQNSYFFHRNDYPEKSTKVFAGTIVEFAPGIDETGRTVALDIIKVGERGGLTC